MLLDFRFLDLNQTLCGHFCKRLWPVGNESVPCIVENHQAQCFFYLFIFWIHRREYTDSAKALFSSCYFLTCDVTLTAVHMAQYISRRHLILVGGGKTVSDNDTMSRHGLLATKCIFFSPVMKKRVQIITQDTFRVERPKRLTLWLWNPSALSHI